MKNRMETCILFAPIFIISVLITSLILSTCICSSTQNLQEKIENLPMNPQYVPSGSLEIVGNDQLRSVASLLGWRGKGTISDPIVIINFAFIENNSWYCLSLSECSLYIVFEKCFFIGTNNIPPFLLSETQKCNLSLVQIYRSLNVVFNNCTFQNSTGNGLWFKYSHNDIKNITITSSTFSDNLGHGIRVSDLIDNLNISRCKFNNNWGLGLYLGASGDSLIVKDNHFEGSGLLIREFHSDSLIEGNMVNGIPLLKYKGVKNLKLDSSYNISQIVLFNCSNITITDQVFDSVGLPIYARNCSNILILNCIFSNNFNDVRFTGNPSEDYSFNVQIINCTMTNFRDVSVRFGTVRYSFIINSIFNGFHGAIGIELSWAFYNLISGCQVMNTSSYGIVLGGESSRNNLTYCTIENCISYAVFMFRASKNLIQYNNFINNGGSYSQVYDEWINKIVNNYWSDGIHSDLNGDNYSDYPYYINTEWGHHIFKNNDSLPLMSPSIYHYSTPFSLIEVPPSTTANDLMFQTIFLLFIVVVGLVSFLVGIISKYKKV